MMAWFLGTCLAFIAGATVYVAVLLIAPERSPSDFGALIGLVALVSGGLGTLMVKRQEKAKE